MSFFPKPHRNVLKPTFNLLAMGLLLALGASANGNASPIPQTTAEKSSPATKGSPPAEDQPGNTKPSSPDGASDSKAPAEAEKSSPTVEGKEVAGGNKDEAAMTAKADKTAKTDKAADADKAGDAGDEGDKGESQSSGDDKDADDKDADDKDADDKNADGKDASKKVVDIDRQMLDTLPWRSIGPANMSGRITDIAVHNDDRSLWWIATASGGLLKTDNHGVTLEHQFDDQTTVSIGAIAHDPSNKNVLWVGTGEANPRTSVSYGDGVYKSTDGGKTFTHVGLDETYQISRILVDPNDSDTVYVGACGRLYGPNRVRGVFKTTDGGKTWDHSLYVNDDTGVIDMVMDPDDPNTIIAAMWNHRRDGYDSWPGSVPRPDGIDGYDPIIKYGKGAGLYKTTDGGKNWTRLKNGLPDSPAGRIGLDWQTGGDHTLVAIIDCKSIGKGPKPFEAYLGVVGKDASTTNSKAKRSKNKASTNSSVTITQVIPGSPADKAGIQEGDMLTKIGDDSPETFADLLDVLRSKKPGQKISLTVRHVDADQPETVDVRLDHRPETRRPTPTVWLGVTGEDGEKGVLLKSVSKSSPAEQAKLKPGDIVVQAADQPMQSFDELVKLIKGLDDGEILKLAVRRGEEDLNLTAKIALRPGRESSTQNRAFMGIQGEDADGGGARMLVITDGGPSAKAGMKSGDVIVKVGDQTIKDYQGLIGEIRSREPSDKMKVTVKREDKEIPLTVTLGDRAGGDPDRPYTYSYYGQRPNIQDMQGADGHKYGGVYKSSDGGESWIRVNSLNTRPMYFSVIRVDPSDDSKLYVLGVSQFQSTDGGRTFQSNFGRGVHADAHDLWIDPSDGDHMIIAGDGGIYTSYDRGEHWDHINTAAIGQFYHAAIIPGSPYGVVGGLQDNGSWAGPAISRSGGSINEDWISVGGGDGFVCRVDENDPDLIYYESQNGAIARRHMTTGERAGIRPKREKNKKDKNLEFRFNWETPFILSSHNSKIFYSAGNYVFRSYDRGDDLKRISPQITRTPRGSATDIAESPIDSDVLYVGTDDGFLWATTDGGKRWNNITKNLDAPKPLWVSSVEASHHQAGRVYVALDGHRSDDDAAYVYVSDDYGKTFRPLHKNLPRGSSRCLREDPVREGLLYLGTEFDFYFSIDGGDHWVIAGDGLPTVSVHDVATHGDVPEIVLATHGRSLWACDVSPLRQLDADSTEGPAHLFPPAAVTRWRSSPRRGGTNRRYVAENPDRGAAIYYLVNDDAKSVRLEIRDIGNELIRTIEGKKESGLHRAVWDMTKVLSQPGRRSSGFRGGRLPVPSGTYRVTLMVDKTEVGSELVELKRDPDLPEDAVADEVYEQDELRLQTAKSLKNRAKDEGVEVYRDN